MTVKICMAAGKLTPSGGVESFSLQYGLAVAKPGRAVTILASSKDFPRSHIERLREAGVSFEECDCTKGGWKALAGYAGLVKRVRRLRPDILYTNGQSGFARILRRFATGKPYWIHHHHMDIGPELLPGFSEGYRKVLRDADMVVACSPGQRDFIDATFARSGRTVFLPYLKSEGVPRPRSRTAEGPVVVGYFGVLRVAKGVRLLLDWAEWFHANRFVCRLNGPDRERLLPAEIPPGIEWAGEYSNDAELDRRLRETDIVAMPSLSGEGLPLVMCEALSRGIPVVAFDGGGQRDFRSLHPGLAVLPADPAAFRAALVEMRSRMAAPGFGEGLAAAYRGAIGNRITLDWWDRTIGERSR